MSLRPTNRADKATPTLLTHPLAIHDTVTALFPLARVTMTIQPKLTVEIDISPRITPMTLDRAVDKKKFEEVLNCMQAHLAVNNSNSTMTVDPKDFSLPSLLLTNWQKWQRDMWERRGGNCVNCIFDYLMDNTENAISLGFAQDQVDTNPTEEDLSYFRQIPGRFEYTDRDRKAMYIKKIKKLYPNISKTIYPHESSTHTNQ